ncbi:MAG: recombinase family protein [Eubacteriales bacterium]|nr:recombinase family protein [Eubacteriales bacterium]
MDQYCLYLRKSRSDLAAEARGEGESLARHEGILMRLAKSRGYTIGAVYKEIVSGDTIAARPVVQHLLREVEQGKWRGVLVVEVERLARGETIDQGVVAQTFKYSNTLIITPLKIYDPNNEFDEEYFEFGLFMSRREYKTINRRLQQGRAAASMEGKYVGSRCPFGYRRVLLQSVKGITLEIVPEEAQIVKMIFDFYLHGTVNDQGKPVACGYAHITRLLNASNLPAARSKRWSPATIAGMLRNPIYTGKIRWNHRPQVKAMSDGEIVTSRPRNPECLLMPGLHEPIISDEQFAAVATKIQRRGHAPAPKHLPIKNPLARLVKCGVCGRNMDRRPYQSGRQPSLICRYSDCPNVSADLCLVERRVLDGLALWLKNYRLEWDALGSTPADEQLALLKASADRLQEALQTQERQMSRLYDLLEQGVYTTDIFVERSAALAAQRSAAQQELAQLDGQAAALRQAHTRMRVLVPKIEHLLQVYDNITDPQIRNDMLSEIIEKAVYLKTNKRGRFDEGAAEDFEITLYPRLD